MCGHALPPLKQRPSEYIRGPQYFQSIQLHEGERSLVHAIDALGDAIRTRVPAARIVHLEPELPTTPTPATLS